MHDEESFGLPEQNSVSQRTLLFTLYLPYSFFLTATSMETKCRVVL